MGLGGGAIDACFVSSIFFLCPRYVYVRIFRAIVKPIVARLLVPRALPIDVLFVAAADGWLALASRGIN